MNNSLLSREMLTEYQKRDDFLAVVHLILRSTFHIAFILTSYFFLKKQQYTMALLAITPHYVMYSFFGWAGIGHELFHNTVFRNTKFNQFLFKFFSILTWNNHEYFKVSHSLHHRETLSDADLENTTRVKLGLLDILAMVSFDVFTFYRRLRVILINAIARIPNQAKGYDLLTHRKTEIAHAARVIIIFHVSLISFFAFFENYFFIFAINLAPFFMTILNKLLSLAQHYGLKQDSKGTYLSSTRTVILNPILSFFYANMNYHVEHHYYPTVPYYNLEKVHSQFNLNSKSLNRSKSLWQAIGTMKEHGLFTFIKKEH